MITQSKLRFGTAGIPLSTPDRSIINGVPYVRTLGLECMELEFVRAVNVSEAKAPIIKELAKKNDVMLTCHGQYFINLNSKEDEKVQASMHRIYQAAKIASMCGAYSLTFHAGFYQGMDRQRVTEVISENLRKIIGQLKKEGYDNIWIRPETTGKDSQWGTLREILDVAKQFDCVLPCVDFSHIHARSGGKENNLESFKNSLSMIEKEFGRIGLDNMHIHVSGIEYTAKGERNHLDLPESDMNYKDLMKAFHEFKIKGCIISESPNIEGDAVLMQKTYEKIK